MWKDVLKASSDSMWNELISMMIDTVNLFDKDYERFEINGTANYTVENGHHKTFCSSF